MGSLENPLVHCYAIRDILNRINRVHSELIDHENTLPKCEICWQNHAEFNSLKAQLFLIVQDNVSGKEEERPTIEYVQLQEDIQIQPLTMEVKDELQEEHLDIPFPENYTKSDVEDNRDSWESNSEACEIVKEIDSLRKKPKKEKISCHFCSKTFYQGERLTEHMARHTGDKPFKCTTCGKTFKSLDYYTTHCKSHEKDHVTESTSYDDIGRVKDKNDFEKKSFTCEICSHNFSKKRQIISHMQLHLRSNFAPSRKTLELIDDKTCKSCCKKFSTFRGLKKHLKFHEKKQKTGLDQNATLVEETPYPCEICKRFFRNSVTLERHKESRDKANLNCDSCSENFCRTTDLYNHQKIVHKVKTAFECRHCDQKFSNFRLIYKHHKMMHPKLIGPTRPFLCEMCGLSMVDSRDLNRHMMIHRGVKPHQCNICDKTFRLQTELEQHRRVHIPIAQLQDLYACDMCPKKFRMKLTLWRHKRIHTGQITEMFCQVCRRRFINANNLEIHMLKHANEAPRPFKCETCGKYFKIRKEYNLHMKRKHGIFSLEKSRIRKKP